MNFGTIASEWSYSHSGVLGVHAVVCHACVVWGYTSVMLRIAVEVHVAGRVCGAGCSIFSQTVDRLPPLTADRSLVSQVGRNCIACCDWEMRLRVGGPSPWWTRSTRVTRRPTSAATWRPLGRRRVACRPISVMPWCRSTRSAYRDCVLSLITWRICSDADR